MSKKHKHPKNKSIENYRDLANETLEERANADLSQGNFRRAKEWLKELCKRDKPRYLPQLLECYRSLAAQMLEKGQTAEANTVYEQILQLGGKAEKVPIVVSKPAPVPSVGPASDKVLPSPGGADVDVLAFIGVYGQGKDHSETNGETAAISRALESVCAERYSEAIQELKPIGLKSPFAGWRIFIKGLCAFYQGDDARAGEAFRRLADEPYLSKAARPFLYIIDAEKNPPDRQESKEWLISQACAALGRKDLEHILPRAEYLWQTGRYSDSYEHVAKTMNGFPSEIPGLCRVMTRFYFNAVFHMEDHKINHYLKRIQYVGDRKKNNLVDRLILCRTINLLMEADQSLPPREIVKMWEGFLELHTVVHGEHSKLQAFVYTHLGMLFSWEEKHEDPFSSFFDGQRKRKNAIPHARFAEDAYRKSLALNGTDKTAHLGLLYLYEKTGDMGKYNKKLDEISRLFPDDKNILVLNGRACIQRKAFSKGIENLKRASALDPLDRMVKQDLVVAYIKAALSFAGKKETARYRAFMQQALALDDGQMKSLALSRPYLRLRLAALEWIAGCDEEADRELAEVLDEGGEKAALCYFAYLIVRLFGAPQAQWSKLDKRFSREFQNIPPAEMPTLMEMLEYLNASDLPKNWIGREYDRLNRLAIRSADQLASPAIAEKIIAFAHRQKFSATADKLAASYIRAGLVLDAENPLFLYWQLMEEKKSRGLVPAGSDLKRLNALLATAGKRNDRQAIHLLTRTIRNIEDRQRGNISFDDDEFEMSESEAINAMLDAVTQTSSAEEKKTSRGNSKKRPQDASQGSLFDDIPF